MDLNYFVDEEKITRCAKCLYPHTKPDLFFNEQGICSACIAYEMRKKTDWLSRQSDLEAILDSHRAAEYRQLGPFCHDDRSGSK